MYCDSTVVLIDYTYNTSGTERCKVVTKPKL